MWKTTFNPSYNIYKLARPNSACVLSSQEPPAADSTRPTASHSLPVSSPPLIQALPDNVCRGVPYKFNKFLFVH